MSEISARVAADSGVVVVREVETNVVELRAPQQPSVVEVIHQGPQGHTGPAGATTLSGLTDVTVSNRVNRSVLYYDSATGQWKGDSLQTIDEVVNGGNF